MKKEEKRSVGRPKLADNELKKSSILFIISAVILVVIATIGSIFSLKINTKNLNANVTNFKYYRQNDSRWASKNFCGRTVNKNTMAGAACGVTSMAMILATLENNPNITPVTTMNEARKGGFCGNYISGTDYKYFKYSAEKHNLKYEEAGKNANGVAKIKQALKGNDSLVLVNVGPKSPFTSGGHYVVIYKIAKNGEVYVADPNPKKGNKRSDTYDLQKEFINKGWVTNGWAIISRKTPTTTKKYDSKNINTYSIVKPNTQPNSCTIKVLGLNNTKVKYQLLCKANSKPISVRLIKNGTSTVIKNGFDNRYGFIGTYVYETKTKFDTTDKLILDYAKEYIGNGPDGEKAKAEVNLYNNGKSNIVPLTARTSQRLLPKDSCKLSVYNVTSTNFSWKFTCSSGASPESLRLTTKDNEFVGKQLAIISSGYKGAYGVSDSKVTKNKVNPNQKYTLVLYFRAGDNSWYRTYTNFITPNY